MTTRSLLTGLLVAGSLLASACSLDTVPPRSLTHARMMVLKRRILRFATAQNDLPATLTGLPRLQGFDNGLTDAWGRPIQFSVAGDIVTLVSLGCDGSPGGTVAGEPNPGVQRTRSARR
jgi:hypothetical protein